MIKNRSLKIQLLIYILFFISIAVGLLFYFSYYNLKEKVDFSQENLYSEKIDNIIYLIDQKYQKLQKTGIPGSYEDSFKKGTIETIKEVFYRENNDIYPFIINKKRVFILGERGNEEEFKRITSIKDGNFDLINIRNDKWIIFKYYKKWDWIIGYRVYEKVKYKELNEFKDNFIMTALLILLFTSIIIIFIVKLVLKPVTSLTNVTKRIALGELETKIDIYGSSELKDLSKNFQIMRDKILEDMDKLKEHDRKIEDLNKELQNKVEIRTQELVDQKNIFETLFYDTSDGLSLLKSETFIDCNRALLKMLKLKSKEEFLQTKPYLISPTYQPDGLKSEEKMRKVIQECLETGSARFEWVHTKSTGEDFWVEVVLTKVLIKGEILVHVVWRDIQEKKQLEIDIQTKNLELQESNDELETMIENLRKTQNKLIESEKLAGLGNLVAGVAHEINTPVGLGLTGSSHLSFITENIADKYATEQLSEEDFKSYLDSAKELTTIVNSNLERTADIVKSFKQVAVDQTSELERVFNVKEYIRGILVSIDSMVKKRDIEFDIECDDDLVVTSFPGFFAQILTNLIANSVLHAYEENDKGKISISAKLNKNGLNFIYKDDGKGIPKDNLLKVYDPFFTTNREAGGTGLGLNIVYNLVTINLKGTIECSSTEGVGTTFKISIPV